MYKCMKTVREREREKKTVFPTNESSNITGLFTVELAKIIMPFVIFTLIVSECEFYSAEI